MKSLSFLLIAALCGVFACSSGATVQRQQSEFQQSAHVEHPVVTIQTVRLWPVAKELQKRCRAVTVKIPADWNVFHGIVTKWLASCVQSRTNNARREQALLSGNDSLRRLWESYVPGDEVFVAPTFHRAQSGKITGIEFYGVPSHQMARELVRKANRPRFTDPGLRRAEGLGTLDTTPRPPESRQTVLPPPDMQDTIEDAKDVEDWLRKEGRDDAADKLGAYIREASRQATIAATILAGYYLASRYIAARAGGRAGRMLFLWSWRAGGPAFQAKLAEYRVMESRLVQSFDILENQRQFLVRGATNAPIPESMRIGTQYVIGYGQNAMLRTGQCGPLCVQRLLREGHGISSPDDLIRLIDYFRLFEESGSLPVHPGDGATPFTITRIM